MTKQDDNTSWLGTPIDTLHFPLLLGEAHPGLFAFFAFLLPRDENHDGQKNIYPMVVG